jgi:predicted nucleotidyltransferase
VRFQVLRLALFGSAAKEPRPAEPRDYDLLVEFDSLTPAQHAGSYFGLLEELETLLEGSVDLVEPGAIRNPIFKQAVEATQVPLYAAA